MTTVRPEDIRFIFYLPNLSSYRDRANLVAHIARKVGRGVLVTSRLDVAPEEIGIQDLEIVEAPRRGRYPGSTSIAASRAVGKLIDDGDFNVVHDTFAHLLPLFLRRRRHPGQVFVTSLYILAEWELRRWIWPRYRLKTFTHINLRAFLFRSLTQRAMVRMADAVVVQAPGLIDRLGEHVPGARSKTVSIPNNVVSPRQLVKPLRSSVGQSSIRLLFVGAFSVGKGADHLLTLLGRARARGVPLEAVVVGSASPVGWDSPLDYPHFSRRIRNEGLQDSITFHARVPPPMLETFYGGASWLFHVSSQDGSPRVVLEALVRGTPVIGSRHPGIEVVDQNGEFILFADPFDPDELLDRLVAAKADPEGYAKRAHAGRMHAEQHLSSDAVSERYVDLYSRLVSERLA